MSGRSKSTVHITLAILTRNRPERLALALDAAMSGTAIPDDIVVSDDSDDDERVLNQEITARYADVRYTEGPRRGLGANENHVVSNLLDETDWVVFIGDDARLSRDFVERLRELLGHHAPYRRIPTGIEIRNGVLVRPNRLNFLGYQSKPHRHYSPGSPMETVVVQATAFPHEALREVSWLEVSPYGYDEVDMAAKMRRLGWSIVFEPSLCVYHDQASEGRDEYSIASEVARMYFRLKSHSIYDCRPASLAAYFVVAPLHLAAVHVRRRNWRQLASVPRIALTVYWRWFCSLRSDWRYS
jgi:GT2 family glycosyltransferase